MKLTPEQREQLEAYDNRRLDAAEFQRRVDAPWSDDERESFAALCAWFVRRYPTPLERLQATRRLMTQWLRNTPTS
jgi:hypothetical protein